MFILDIAYHEESGSFEQAKRARLGELEKDTTGRCQREHEHLPGLEENCCQLNSYFISGSTLSPEELLLYALMKISFKTSTFSRHHTTSRYTPISQAISRVCGIYFKAMSIRQYFPVVSGKKFKS